MRRLALAADAVTAYAGAVGQLPGAVVAGGTGMIALGTDLTSWRRADGWGHLLGDSGGGAWIGRAGLDAAMRAHDGRRGGSAPLLARLEAVFGRRRSCRGCSIRVPTGLPYWPRSRPKWPRVPDTIRSPQAFCAKPPDISQRRPRRCAPRPGPTTNHAKWP